MKPSTPILLIPLLTILAGCANGPEPIINTPNRPTAYIPSDTPGPVQGNGIESQDIESMCDKMVRDILASGVIKNGGRAPRIIMDSTYFTNNSSNRIDLDMITDRMRVNLQRAAGPQIVFIARQSEAAVLDEQARKQAGMETAGAVPTSGGIAGADYRLLGRLTSRDAVDPKTGMQQRYTQVTFELMNLENETIVWSNLYTLNKATQDDVIYR